MTRVLANLPTYNNCILVFSVKRKKLPEAHLKTSSMDIL